MNLIDIRILQKPSEISLHIIVFVLDISSVVSVKMLENILELWSFKQYKTCL